MNVPITCQVIETQKNIAFAAYRSIKIYKVLIHMHIAFAKIRFENAFDVLTPQCLR